MKEQAMIQKCLLGFAVNGVSSYTIQVEYNIDGIVCLYCWH